jgi:hypothetical protein
MQNTRRRKIAWSGERMGTGKNSPPVGQSAGLPDKKTVCQSTGRPVCQSPGLPVGKIQDAKCKRIVIADSYSAGGKYEEENTENKFEIKKLRRAGVSPV